MVLPILSHNVQVGGALHDLKGVAAATDNYVATANGSGATVWKILGPTNVNGNFTSFASRLLHVRYKENSGTDNQETPAQLGSVHYAGVRCNTVVTNQISGASLASSVITLPAGTYRISADVWISWPEAAAGLFLKVGSTYTLLLKSLYAFTSGTSLVEAGHIRMLGDITLAGTSDVRFGANALTPSFPAFLGTAMSTGDDEIYLDARIWKVA